MWQRQTGDLGWYSRRMEHARAAEKQAPEHRSSSAAETPLALNGALALQSLIGNRGTMAALGVMSRRRGGVVQRAGVKSELNEAEAKFDSFKEETTEVSQLRGDISNDLYNVYKPGEGGRGQAFGDKRGRWRSWSQLFNPAAAGPSPQARAQARYRAQGLNQWSDTAVNSARRIYAELVGAIQQAEAQGRGGEAIQMGTDTKREADAFIDDTTALESKHVTSPAQGSVDGHIFNASRQLDKRVKNPKANNVAVTKWVAHITIDNRENPWPFTPTQLETLGKQNLSSQQALSHLLDATKARVKKYKGVNPILVRVRSANPRLGSAGVFWVDVP